VQIKTATAVFITGVGALLLMAAAMMPGLVGAQSSDETPEATATADGEPTDETTEGSKGSTDGEDCGPMFGARGVLMFGIGPLGGETLAEALGVTVEELREAAETARESLGELERPQSDEEREALKAEIQAAFASALGISVEELEAALDEVMEEHKANAIARIEAAVEAGTLSRERADAMIENIESGERPFFPGVRPGRGRFHDFEGARFAPAEELAPVLLPST
jgi:hypothetical protein